MKRLCRTGAEESDLSHSTHPPAVSLLFIELSLLFPFLFKNICIVMKVLSSNVCSYLMCTSVIKIIFFFWLTAL